MRQVGIPPRQKGERYETHLYPFSSQYRHSEPERLYAYFGWKGNPPGNAQPPVHPNTAAGSAGYTCADGLPHSPSANRSVSPEFADPHLRSSRRHCDLQRCGTHPCQWCHPAGVAGP